MVVFCFMWLLVFVNYGAGFVLVIVGVGCGFVACCLVVLFGAYFDW